MSQIAKEVTEFIERLRSLHQHPMSTFGSLLEPTASTTIARAPGRLDVMGGIADYSGSLVLQMPIAEATWVALQRTEDDCIRIGSLDAHQPSASRYFEIGVGAFAAGEVLGSYAAARRYFHERSNEYWVAYVIGVLLVLLRRTGRQLSGGLRIYIDSRVPEGKGVSSSAALEVATLNALIAALDLAVDPLELALWAHEAENQVAGAPCGVMDPIASECGREGELLALSCQPASLEGFVALPPDIAFYGIDSGVRHVVSGSDYATVRAGAFMGYRILLGEAFERCSQPIPSALVAEVDARFRGYLSNVSPSEWVEKLSERVPRTISGCTFLEQWGHHLDSVTQIEPSRVYAVRAPTAHAVFENHRCRVFRAMIGRATAESELEILGELMLQSHASYGSCGLGSMETDCLVRLAREFGPARGIYGARVTGGGSGGTVAFLARRFSAASIAAIAERYQVETGRAPTVFSGTSAGAAMMVPIQLEPGFERRRKER
jgi:L-arabinokinase